MVEVSVLILARNEEANLKECIGSCSFAADIVVIDDNSTDNTVALAESLGARVVNHALNGDYGAQENFAIAQARCPWIFIIDADERCSPELAAEIGQVVGDNAVGAYWIKRKTMLRHYQVGHGPLRPDYVLRLMPKEGARVEGRVHQRRIAPYPEKKLKSYLYHYTYANWQQYLNKLNSYSGLMAERYRERGKQVCFFRDVVLRPLWAFFKVYVVNLGFLDGKMGYILSVDHAFYTMTKYVRLYCLYKSDGKL